jgi:hypothetical protein
VCPSSSTTATHHGWSTFGFLRRRANKRNWLSRSGGMAGTYSSGSLKRKRCPGEARFQQWKSYSMSGFSHVGCKRARSDFCSSDDIPPASRLIRLPMALRRG